MEVECLHCESLKEIYKEDSNVNRDKTPLVSIICITFNQSRYIAQAIEGFLSQKTNFFYEVIIHDDCSTDNTPAIIEEYRKKNPTIIKPILQKVNQYTKQGYKFIGELYNIAKGKYIAFCEGDDYWIDKFKLQKQVDYLKNNPSVKMCYTNFNIYYEKTGQFEKNLFNSNIAKFKTEYSLKEWILLPGYVGPMTWLFEKSLMNNYKFLDTLDETFVMFSHFLHETNVVCLIGETTAVYRSLNESASHSRKLENIYQRAENMLHVQKTLVHEYHLPENMIDDIERRYYNRVYKLISVLGKEEEVENAKIYCKRIDQKILFILSSNRLIRRLLKKIYIKMRK